MGREGNAHAGPPSSTAVSVACTTVRTMTTWADITTAMAVALSGDTAAGLRDLTACWEGAREEEHAQRCVVAHHLADLQTELDDEVAWDERALEAYAGVAEGDLAQVGIPDARGLAPSLHLNLGDGYLRQGRVDEAELQLGLGLAAEEALDDDAYGAMIRGGLLGLSERIAEARKPQAN